MRSSRPLCAPWLEGSFGVEVLAIQNDPVLIRAKDREIYAGACEAGAVVMTKDQDFVEMVRRLGPPPPILWVTVGDTSNRVIKEILSNALPRAIEQIQSGEALVEISRAR